jgi:hypothetical protein
VNREKSVAPRGFERTGVPSEQQLICEKKYQK